MYVSLLVSQSPWKCKPEKVTAITSLHFQHAQHIDYTDLTVYCPCSHVTNFSPIY